MVLSLCTALEPSPSIRRCFLQVSYIFRSLSPALLLVCSHAHLRTCSLPTRKAEFGTPPKAELAISTLLKPKLPLHVTMSTYTYLPRLRQQCYLKYSVRLLSCSCAPMHTCALARLLSCPCAHMHTCALARLLSCSSPFLLFASSAKIDLLREFCHVKRVGTCADACTLPIGRKVQRRSASITSLFFLPSIAHSTLWPFFSF
jgi:hypothetical protein